MAEEGRVTGGDPRWMTVLTGPPRNGAYCSNQKKEEMVDDDRCCREVVKVMDQAQGGATTGVGDGGGPAGEARTSREALGEGRTATLLTVATGVAETMDGIGMMLGIVRRGWIIF